MTRVSSVGLGPSITSQPTGPAAPASAPQPVANAVVPESSFTATSRSGSASLSRTQLEQGAAAAEARVLDTARRLASASSPGERQALQAQVQEDLRAWKAMVQPLAHQKVFDSGAVKSFLSKFEQASLISQNVPPGLEGDEYARAAEKAVREIFVDAEQVLANNPLVLVPSVSEPHSPASLAARGIPTTEVSITGADGQPHSGPVRSDVVMLFCPGVITDETQFRPQSQAALEAGLYAVRAPTGTFIDPEENARTIAQSIRDARAAVKNPNAKVVLVGYSQGATNVFAFMRDKNNEHPELLRDVAAIHTMHSAARGSQVIDTTLALHKAMKGDEPLTDRDQALLAAFKQAVAVELQRLGSAESVDSLIQRTGSALQTIGSKLKELGPLAAEALGGGVDPADGVALAARLFKFAVEGKDWTEALAGAGAAGAGAAAKLGPLWRGVINSPEIALLRNPEFQQLLDTRLAGLNSLTTDYGEALMRDPLTREHTAGIPVLNTIGEVPPEREKELVSPLNELNYQLFQALGLPGDSQVSVAQQELSSVLSNAVDLPPEAVGHWGAAGLIVPGDHDEKYFHHFSPTGLTRSVLSTLQSVGTL